METTKQNPLPQAQESDDLIAELARLVAQDARSRSVNSAAYTQPASPAPGTFGADEGPRHGPGTGAQDRQPDAPAYRSESQQVPSPDPTFDINLSAASPEAPDVNGAGRTQTEHDLIADLIANAEEERFASDEADGKESDFFDPGLEPSVHDDFAPDAGGGRYEPAVDGPYLAVREDGPPEPRPAHQDSQYRPQDDTRDPLQEIEALIGEAARVSIGGGVENGRKVRSSFLDTSDYQDIRAERAVDAAESAILAAAAASGTQLAPERPEKAFHAEAGHEPEIPDAYAAIRNDDDVQAHDPEMDYRAADQREAPIEEHRRRAGFLLPAIAGTAIVVALLGGYFLFLAPDREPSEAPVLTAAPGELKEIPQNTSTPTTASESVIFNEIDGNTVPPENEALVSRDQTNGATGPDVSSVIAPEEGEVGLANRPVRTVTVRPDGTIVSSDDSVAGSNVLPVERPDVPLVPNSTLTADPIGEAIAAAIADDTLPSAPPSGASAGADAAPLPSSAAPVTDAGSAPATIPRPVPRPAGLNVSQAATQPGQSLPTPVQAAPAQQSAPSSASAATGQPVGAWVQLSSQRTEEAARAGIPDLQARYGALFNGVALDVSRVDLGERGVYYRVRLPQPTMADANAVCNAIKGQGGDCFVLNN